jgi:hypothetical protein
MPLAMGEPGVKFVDRGIPASRATRAERWLGIIQREIEDKLIKLRRRGRSHVLGLRTMRNASLCPHLRHRICIDRSQLFQ